jgi:hypothetical protein
MNSLLSNRIVLISGLLILPALLLCACGLLHTAFGFAAANDLLVSVLATTAGKILLSPFVVLGGIASSLLLNLWALCRVRIGFDTGTVYVTFYIARILRHLIFVVCAMLLAGLLLTYAFVENFRIVAR